MSARASWIVVIAAVIFLFLIRAILAPFIVAILLAYILVPGIDFIAKRFRVRRWLVVLAFYILLIALAGGFFWWLRPTLLLEYHELRRDSVAVIEGAIVRLSGGQQLDVFGTVIDANTVAREIVSQARLIANSPMSTFQYAQSFFRIVAETIIVFIALFYLLLDWESLIAFAFRFVPLAQRPRAGALAQDIHNILGAYLRGQLVLVVFVSFITWIALRFFFFIPFALPIAIATGFLEIIPLVGPVVAAGLAAVSAVSAGGPNAAIGVVVFYTVLRQVEDQLIAPNILGRAVHVHPLAAIFASLAGSVVAGVLGLILAVPAAAAVQVILDRVQPPVSPEVLPIRKQPVPSEGEGS